MDARERVLKINCLKWCPNNSEKKLLSRREDPFEGGWPAGVGKLAVFLTTFSAEWWSAPGRKSGRSQCPNLDRDWKGRNWGRTEDNETKNADENVKINKQRPHLKWSQEARKENSHSRVAQRTVLSPQEETKPASQTGSDMNSPAQQDQ